MSTMVKSISIRTTWQSDFTGIQKDLSTLKSLRRNLQSNPIRIPVRLDLSGVRSDAARAAEQYRKALSSSLGSVAPGKGPRGGSTSTATSPIAGLNQATGAEIKRVTTTLAKGKGEIIQSYQQLADGIKKVTTTRGGNSSVKLIDETPIARFRASLAQLERDFAARAGTARGNKGDLAQVLSEKRTRLAKEITQYGDLAGTAEWRRANSMLDRLEGRVAQAVPQQQRAAANDKRKAIDSKADRIIARDNRSTQTALKQNKGEESAAKAILNRTVRERALNTVLNEREKILARQQYRFQRREQVATRMGMPNAAARFENAGAVAGNSLGQVQLDRTRARNSQSIQSQDAQLERRLTNTKAAYQMERELLKLEESRARKISNPSQQRDAMESIASRRAALLGRTGKEITTIEGEAKQRGNGRVASRAMAMGSDLNRQGVRDMASLTAATKASGHAFDFHTSSLLRNAGTFVKWYVPAQAAMKSIQALTSGLSSAVQAERTFKVLNTVFRGTREEAALLASESMMLAAANGRSAEEAAQAAVAWSRLGLTRVQVLSAVETSLRAANVAEISAAEATEYLSATYKGLGMTISDLPSILDYVNALSNRYNVTNKALFEGISRTSGVAKQAGLEFEDLAGIITSVVANTGRPGAEVGNAIKSLSTRIRRPDTMKSLKDEFDIDLTDASGDVLKMRDVLAKLAAVYPTLNRLEKTRFEDLVAGSLQANRFALIMDNYTDSLIAQAKAGFDTNSAQRENSEILSSLDAKIQMLTTSWAAFLLELGQTGAFETVSYWLSIMRTQLDLLNDSKDGGGKGSGTIHIQDENLRAAIGTILGDKTPFAAPKAERSREEIERAVSRMRDAADGSYDWGYSPDEGKRVRGWRKSDREFRGSNFDTLQLKPGESFTTIADALESLIRTKDLADKSTNAVGLTKNVIDGQDRVKSLTAGGNAFSAMGRDIAAKEVDPKKILKQFDDAVELLEHLPGGLQRAAKARLEVRPLIESGDRRGASRALAGIGSEFKTEAESNRLKVEEQRVKALASVGKEADETRGRIQKLNEELASGPNVDRQEAIRKELEATTTTLKNQEEQLRALNKAQKETKESGLTGRRGERLNEFLDDTKALGEAFKQTYESFANTGLPNLDAKLKIGASRIQAEMIRSVLTKTQAQNQGRKDSINQALSWHEGLDSIVNKKPAPSNGSNILPHRGVAPIASQGVGKGLAAVAMDKTGLGIDSAFSKSPALREQIGLLREELSLHEEIATKIASTLEDIEKTRAETERKLEIERQAATLREAFDDGAASAGARAERYSIGRTEGEQIVNRTIGGFADIRSSIEGPDRVGQGDATRSASELGMLTSRLVASKQNLVSIEDRMNRAIADRANLEYSITEEQRKQTIEASKRLSLASREDQLRAAAAAAFMRNRGGKQLSQSEFQFFGQETRGAISGFMPRAVKGLDDTDRDNSEARGKLDGEIKMLSLSLRTLRDEFGSLRPRAENVAGGLVDPKKMFPDGLDGSRVVDLSKDEIRLNLNTGPINIELNMDRHIASLQQVLQRNFDSKIDAALSGLRRELKPRGPDTSAASGAF